jgi:hypothetical protein
MPIQSTTPYQLEITQTIGQNIERLNGKWKCEEEIEEKDDKIQFSDLVYSELFNRGSLIINCNEEGCSINDGSKFEENLLEFKLNKVFKYDLKAYYLDDFFNVFPVYKDNKLELSFLNSLNEEFKISFYLLNDILKAEFREPSDSNVSFSKSYNKV